MNHRDTSRLVGVLEKHLTWSGNGEALPMDVELGQLGLDSMSAISLLLGLEEEFEVIFPDQMLTADTFRTASTLQSAVSSLLGVDGQAADAEG